jgi:ABC-type antimicrobial peptide transport system permease subunit
MSQCYIALKTAGWNFCGPQAGDPLTFRKTVEKTVHELNADLVVFDVTTLELREQFASFGQRVAGTFVGAFGLLALVLAAVGIYGVTAYTTRQRTHEIGVRMALGASTDNILRLVLGHGLRLTLVGVVLGFAASFALTRYLRSMLLGVTSTDALTFRAWRLCSAPWRSSPPSFPRAAQCAWTRWSPCATNDRGGDSIPSLSGPG